MKLSRIAIPGFILLGALPMAGCGSAAADGATSARTVAITVTHTVTPTDSTTIADPSGETPAAPSEVDVTPSSPPTLTAGQRLGLDAFFEPAYVWGESRYDVADRGQVQGVSALVSRCSTPGDSLEMRLENKFKQLKFSVGQSNDSASSKYNLVVAVVANGKQVDVRNIPFNAVQDFSLSVDGVNALEVSFIRKLPEGGCGSSTVRAVVFDGMLS